MCLGLDAVWEDESEEGAVAAAGQVSPPAGARRALRVDVGGVDQGSSRNSQSVMRNAVQLRSNSSLARGVKCSSRRDNRNRHNHIHGALVLPAPELLVLVPGNNVPLRLSRLHPHRLHPPIQMTPLQC